MMSPRMSFQLGNPKATLLDAQQVGQMADDQNEEQHLDSFPKPSVGAAREAEERCRMAGSTQAISEKLGRALEGRDRAASLGTAERAKSSRRKQGRPPRESGNLRRLSRDRCRSSPTCPVRPKFSPGWKVPDNPREDSASCRGCPLQGRGSGAQGD